MFSGGRSMPSLLARGGALGRCAGCLASPGCCCCCVCCDLGRGAAGGCCCGDAGDGWVGVDVRSGGRAGCCGGCCGCCCWGTACAGGCGVACCCGGASVSSGSPSRITATPLFGQAKLSARPAGAVTGSPRTSTRVAIGSLPDGRVGPPPRS